MLTDSSVSKDARSSKCLQSLYKIFHSIENHFDDLSVNKVVEFYILEVFSNSV